jgi:hypothetical protein
MKRMRSFMPKAPSAVRRGTPRFRNVAVMEFVRAEMEIGRLERELEQLRRRGQKTFAALASRRKQAVALHALLARKSGGQS